MVREPERIIALADAVEREMRAQGLDRKQLAHRAGISVDTVDAFFNKKKLPVCSESTLYKLEKAFGKRFVDVEADDAPEELGGYSAKDASRYVGRYLCIRPAFGDKPKSLFVYEMEISWSRVDRCLKFQEGKRPDSHANSGKIYIKDALPYMYLISVDAGEVRHIVLSRTVTRDGTFRGSIQTLWHLGGEQYIPVNAPIALHKISDKEPQVFDLGEVKPKSPMYAKYRELLATVSTNGYLRQFSPPT
jgi:hypothetical protein